MQQELHRWWARCDFWSTDLVKLVKKNTRTLAPNSFTAKTQNHIRIVLVVVIAALIAAALLHHARLDPPPLQILQASVASAGLQDALLREKKPLVIEEPLADADDFAAKVFRFSHVRRVRSKISSWSARCEAAKRKGPKGFAKWHRSVARWTLVIGQKRTPGTPGIPGIPGIPDYTAADARGSLQLAHPRARRSVVVVRLAPDQAIVLPPGYLFRSEESDLTFDILEVHDLTSFCVRGAFFL